MQEPEPGTGTGPGAEQESEQETTALIPAEQLVALDEVYDQAAMGIPMPEMRPALPQGAVLGRWTEWPHPAALWIANTRRISTHEKYQRMLRDFAGWLARERGKSDPLLANFTDLLAWRGELEQRDYRTTTIVGKLADLSAFYGFLVKSGVLPRNPLLALSIPVADDARARRAWSVEEIYAFFAAIPNDGQLIHLRDRALFWLIFRNALRASEVAGARIGDLVVKQGIRVLEVREHGRDDQHVKRGGARDAVLKPQTYDAIAAYLAARGLGPNSEVPVEASGAWRSWPLFAATRDGGRRSGRRAPGTARPAGGFPMTRQTIWHQMRTYGNLAGLDPEILFPHAGRHTAISHLIELKVPTARIKDFSGHHSIATLEHYVHLFETITRNAAFEIPF